MYSNKCINKNLYFDLKPALVSLLHCYSKWITFWLNRCKNPTVYKLQSKFINNTQQAALEIIQMQTTKLWLPHFCFRTLDVQLISIVCSVNDMAMLFFPPPRYALELKRSLWRGSLLQGCSSAALQTAQSACGARSHTPTQPVAIFWAM